MKYMVLRNRNKQQINGIEKYEYATNIEMVLKKQKYRSSNAQFCHKMLKMNYLQKYMN